MKTSEVLLAARELIATPDKWTQDEDARDADGCPTDALSKDAACWCLVGAFRAAGSTGPQRHEMCLTFRRATACPPVWSVTDWNDDPERTHAEVIEALTKAAALAAAEEQS